MEIGEITMEISTDNQTLSPSKSLAGHCQYCQSFKSFVYGVLIGEDGKRYMTRFDAVFCPVCGHKLKAVNRG